MRLQFPALNIPGADNLVPAVFLGLQEGLVGGPDQLFRDNFFIPLSSSGQQGGDANGNSDLACLAVRQFKVVSGDAFPDAFSDVPASAAAGVGKQNHKFFAAVAGKNVAAAQVTVDDVGNVPQDPVSDLVPPSVIDAFKVIKIEKQAGQGLSVTVGPGNLVLDSPVEKSTVENPG